MEDEADIHPDGVNEQDDKTPLTQGDGNANEKLAEATPDATVERLAKQVEEIYQKQGKRWDTFFYKVVLGGNVKVAKQVLDCLKNKGSLEELRWLLDTGDKRKSFHAPVNNKTILKLRQVGMFLLFATISTILSPIFFVIHGITASVFTERKRRLAANIKLPLAYAAFCQNDDMLRFFLSEGVDIEHTDKQGNNVFHYIADISSESADRAIEIFKSTVKFLNDPDVVRQLLARRRNSASLTAIEYASKLGSPALLTHMLNHPNLLQHTEFAVGKEDVCFGNKDMSSNDAEEYETKLELVDVTTYEAGSIKKQSAILNLLSDRDIPDMSLADMELFSKHEFVGKWMALKTKQMLIGVGVLQLIDIAITVFVVCVIAIGFSDQPLWAKWDNLALHAELNEIVAQGNNHSHIIKDTSYHKILEHMQYDLQLKFMKEITSDSDKLQSLLNATMISSEKVVLEKFGYNSSNLQIDHGMPHPVLNALYDTAIFNSDTFKDHYEALVLRRYLQEVFLDYAQTLSSEHKSLISENVQSSNRHYIRNELKTFYANYTIHDVQPSNVFEFWKFMGVFCIDSKYFNDTDLKYEDGVLPPKNLYHDTCGLKAVYDLANKGCKGPPEETYAEITDVFTFYREGKHHIFSDLLIAVALLALLYIILDLIEHWVHFYTCVASHTHVYDMVMSVLSKKIPGSYLRKQLNVLSCFSFLCYFICSESSAYLMEFLSMSWDDFIDYINYFLIIGMILRFVMHIHGLRLLPGIGHFVITTFMMGSNLMHFSAIYTIVLFIFSVIFHILIDDPDCPLKKYDGFEDILSSMFAVFKLTFGHGDVDPYYTSAPVSLTYTIFVIISALLLMNLIIAIMSATATDILTDPWKDTLYRMEWLDEALSVEYTFSVLTLPFAKCFHCGYWSHKQAGYDVRHDSSKGKRGYRVYIEVFRCPALE